MVRNSRRLTILFLCGFFAILTLNLKGYFEKSSGIGQQEAKSHELPKAQRKTDDIPNSLQNSEATKDSSYRKKEVRLFAGTLFFNMPVTNERFLGNCSVRKHCKIIDNRELADAVLYHAADYVDLGQLNTNQIAVLWNLESPISHRLWQNFHRRINWIMSYRLDADVWLPYGIIKKSDHPNVIDYEQIWEMKNMTAVWLISNCGHRNGRIALTRAIQASGIEVDIYGKCGNKRTPNNCDGVDKQSDNCVAELFKPYKFAIAFENSLCKDYITEKFFEVLQKRYAVSIVMQRKRYEDAGAPENSFIAVSDFENVTELANYLRSVAGDKQKYLRYHKWRESFTVESAYFNIEETGFCQLCKKIMRQEFEPKYYESPSEWHTKGVCEHPQDAFVNNFLNK